MVPATPSLSGEARPPHCPGAGREKSKFRAYAGGGQSWRAELGQAEGAALEKKGPGAGRAAL